MYPVTFQFLDGEEWSFLNNNFNLEMEKNRKILMKCDLLSPINSNIGDTQLWQYKIIVQTSQTLQ